MHTYVLHKINRNISSGTHPWCTAVILLTLNRCHSKWRWHIRKLFLLQTHSVILVLSLLYYNSFGTQRGAAFKLKRIATTSINNFNSNQCSFFSKNSLTLCTHLHQFEMRIMQISHTGSLFVVRVCSQTPCLSIEFLVYWNWIFHSYSPYVCNVHVCSAALYYACTKCHLCCCTWIWPDAVADVHKIMKH